MIFSPLLLFTLTLISGLLALRIQKVINGGFRHALVFAGAYLLGITVVHILPELFEESQSLPLTGLFVLLGFFLQKVLEYFTAGVEHGHMHQKSGDHHHHHHGSALFLLIALCIHSVMEGSLLGHPSHSHQHGDNQAILIGIILHKVPAAFALMSILSCQFKSRRIPLLALITFALATPIGIVLSELSTSNGWLNEQLTQLIFALVTGSFLHIATTIFFENSPGEHRFGLKRMLISLLGAGLAVLVEFSM